LAFSATELSKISVATKKHSKQNHLVCVEGLFRRSHSKDTGILGGKRGACQGSFGKKVEKTPNRLSQACASRKEFLATKIPLVAQAVGALFRPPCPTAGDQLQQHYAQPAHTGQAGRQELQENNTWPRRTF
jgi:hypothetical protein